MIDRKDVEIRNQQHERWAEGCHSDKPDERDISGLLLNEGYSHKTIELWIDTLQGLWRWHCEIRRI